MEIGKTQILLHSYLSAGIPTPFSLDLSLDIVAVPRPSLLSAIKVNVSDAGVFHPEVNVNKHCDSVYRMKSCSYQNSGDELEWSSEQSTILT